MKRILSFLKKDAVLTAAWTLAILSMAAVPPSIRYISYLDLHTLGLLFCLMATMAGLQAMGFFHQMGESLLMRIHSLRQLEMLLVLLCFFSSMFITNDVALITFVPFAIELLKMIRREDRLIPVVVLQTIAANLGSMATPIGNPQNLYLYSHYHLGMGAFLRIMLPFALLSLLLILLALLRGKNQPLSFGLSEMQTVSGVAPFCRKSLLSYLLMFLLCLGAVGKWIPIPFLLLAVVCLGLFADRAIFSKVDYSLLITFAGFFIFIGNMKQIPWISSLFQQLITGNELLCSVAVSQVISNVPAALLAVRLHRSGRLPPHRHKSGRPGNTDRVHGQPDLLQICSQGFSWSQGKIPGALYSHECALSGHPSSGRRSSPTERPSVVKRSFPEYKKRKPSENQGFRSNKKSG